MTQSTNTPSEMAGYPGLTQPEPHVLTSAEQARLERSLDPADVNDSVEQARVREGGQP